MHKLKNKHTSEVITTPYMAEVEECLNSGDYEMYKSENEIAIEETKARSHKENERKLCDLREFLARSNLRVIGCSAVDTAIKLIEDAYIAKDKSVYTKEMHERGELPPIGSIVKWGSYEECEVLIGKPDVDNCIVISKGGKYLPVQLGRIKPVPGIQDELSELIVNNPNVAELIRLLVKKYNITPKDS